MDVKRRKFEAYSTGSDTVTFSYTEGEKAKIFCKIGRDERSISITEDDVNYLNSLHSTEQMAAASVFGALWK
jgi:hypothetical protein